MPLNFNEYTAEFSDKDDESYYVILHKGKDIIVIPKLEVVGDDLLCDFKFLDNDFSDDDIRGMVVIVLLKNFLSGYYSKKIKFVKFKNIITGHSFQSVYLG